MSAILPILVKSNLTATVDPSATDDSAAGYSVNSTWLNTTTQVFWRCASATASAAVWEPMQVSDHPGYRASRIYPIHEGTYTVNTSPAAVDTIYISPYFLRAKVTLTALMGRVVTAGTGSAMKMAVYANSPSLMLPVGAPLLVNNTGVATTSNNTNASLSVSGSLSPGVYWWAQKHTGTLPVMSGMSASQRGWMSLMGRVSGGSLASTPVAFSLADTYSNNFPTLAGNEAWADVVANSPEMFFVL